MCFAAAILNFLIFGGKRWSDIVVPAIFEIGTPKNPLGQSFMLLSRSAHWFHISAPLQWENHVWMTLPHCSITPISNKTALNDKYWYIQRALFFDMNRYPCIEIGVEEEDCWIHKWEDLDFTLFRRTPSPSGMYPDKSEKCGCMHLPRKVQITWVFHIIYMRSSLGKHPKAALPAFINYKLTCNVYRSVETEIP